MNARLSRIRKFARFIPFVLVAASAASPVSARANFEGEDSFLTRAAYAEGRLWVLTASGDVSSLAEGEDKRLNEALPEPALDLCTGGVHPMVVTGKEKGGSAWTLRLHTGDAWPALVTVPTKGDHLLAMTCADGKVTLLTTRRLVEFDGKHQSAVTLSDEFGLGPGRVASSFGTPDQFYVGLNAGEWGGGLVRIDRASGKLSLVERNASGDICGGPLNHDCDPVNGIVAEPGKPGCIAVAIGLVHMMASGRITEVCGDQVEKIYAKAYGKDMPNSTGKDEGTRSTVAFFGLSSDGNTMQAVGIDGIYNLGAGGAVQFSPLPQFKSIGGLGVSFDIPHYVLVLTTINQRLSVSGAVPIMVPR